MTAVFSPSGPNAISVSLSPMGCYVMVGLASRRILLHPTTDHMVAQVFRLQQPHGGETSIRVRGASDLFDRKLHKIQIRAEIRFVLEDKSKSCQVSGQHVNDDDKLKSLCEIRFFFYGNFSSTYMKTHQAFMFHCKRLLDVSLIT